ncbi:MAG: helix-turn-helix transcriptional regulator [Bacteroidetes bacterium]|nr:helix-turn-helix transcriptional regulator [Bacteroidota bacterium]MBK8143886.1 helix-turn-helix transcriptional regulator [Bacteroidota bacterium]MBP6314026.1 helix-turn-helix transcriptional regulator [Chitinophagaceae bacterium]
MTQVNFLNSTTIEVIVPKGEQIFLTTHLPVHYTRQKSISQSMAKAFDENLSDDKLNMTYWVLMKMMAEGFSFSFLNEDRNIERERIGARIRELREDKGFDAKRLAMLANIDAANLSRIEQGRYSVGLDILVKISQALGVRIDLI